MQLAEQQCSQQLVTRLCSPCCSCSERCVSTTSCVLAASAVAFDMAFFAIKVDSNDALDRAYASPTWATPLHRHPPQPHEALAAALAEVRSGSSAPLSRHDAESASPAQWHGSVFLVFSVNGSRAWQAIARMDGDINEQNVIVHGNRPHVVFPIEWLYRCTVTQHSTHGLPFKNVEDLTVRHTHQSCAANCRTF